MNETKIFCRQCKKFENFTAVEKFMVCPNCGHKFEPSEMSHAVGEVQKDGCLQSIFWVLAVLVGIFLIALAFIYAACAQGLKNI